MSLLVPVAGGIIAAATPAAATTAPTLGDVYIADVGNNQVVKVPAGGGDQTTIAAGLATPVGATVFAPPPTLVADSPPVTAELNSPYAGYTYTATSPPGEPAAMFRVASGTLPPGLSVDLTSGQLTGTPTTAGTFTFQVQAGNYATATASPATTITVPKLTQSITFTSTAPNRAAVGGATYAVTATGGPSGTPVTFTSGTASVCTVTDGTVSFTGVGTCTINADQTGNTNYLAAPQKSQSFTVTASPLGDVYIADTGNNRVVKVPAGGGDQTSIGTGLSYPLGVVVDAAGDVYIADTGHNRVVKVPAGGGDQTSIGTGLSSPLGVAVDAAGNVYIADYGNNRVVKVPAGGGSQTTIGTGLKGPFGVAVDAAGNVYIDDFDNNRVVRVPAGGGSQTTIGTGLNYPFGVTVDAAGNVYIADYDHSRVVKVPASGGDQTTIGTGLRGPTGAAIDAAGNVYIADSDNDRAVKVPAGGGDQTTIRTDLNSPFGVAVFAPPPTLVADSPPLTAALNTPYAGYTYTATSPAGEPAAMFRVASGALPPGLRVDLTSGQLTGTPTTAGTFTFQVQAGNYATATASPATTITVTSAKIAQNITFTSTAPSSATVGGAAYMVAATGGASGTPVTFTVDPVTTNNACSITAAIVVFAHTGTCVIDANQAADLNYSAAPQTQQLITVGQGTNPLTFTTTAPVNARARAGDTYTPIVTGRAGGTITVVTAPAGAASRCRLSDSAIVFTGAGQCVITASDPGDTDYAPAAITQTVTVTAGQISFPADTTLPNATVGQPYSAKLGQPSGGLSPYSWTSTGAALPAGLHLNSLTGTITGNPALAGTFSLTLTITDSENPATAAATHRYQLTITPAATPTTTTPTTTTPITTPTTTVAGGRIVLSAGSVTATGQLTLTLTGLPAGSVDQVVLHSVATVLTTFTATAAGTATVVVNIPAGTVLGEHTITVNDTAGLVLASVPVTVTAAGAGAELPATGFPVTTTLWIGLLTLLTGLTLTISTRRRNRRTGHHA